MENELIDLTEFNPPLEDTTPTAEYMELLNHYINNGFPVSEEEEYVKWITALCTLTGFLVYFSFDFI